MKKKYYLALMNPNQFTVLTSIFHQDQREEYVQNIVHQLGEDHIDSYEFVRLYISEDNFNYKTLFGKEFIKLYEQSSFREAFKEISNIEDFDSFLDSSNFHEEEINLFMLVFCKLEELRLDFDDFALIRSLGGTRERTNKSHFPILKPIEIDGDDPSCSGMPLNSGRCEILYDASLIHKSYRELLESENFLEFYAKSKQVSHEHDFSLKGKYCFLNSVADHLYSAHIRRFFVEEGARISPNRINERKGDFRRSIVRTLKRTTGANRCKEELLLKLAGSSDKAIDLYREEVKSFFKEELNTVQKLKNDVISTFQELEKIEKKIVKKETLEKHLKLLKLFDASYAVSEFWKAMYDETENEELRKEMDIQGGRNLNKVFSQSLYRDITNYNVLNQKLDTSLTMFLKAKLNLLPLLEKRIELIGDIKIAEVRDILINNGLVFDDVSLNQKKHKGITKSYKKLIDEKNTFSGISKVIAAYNQLDKTYVNQIRNYRKADVTALVDKINAFKFGSLEFDESTNNKFIGGVRMNPIKIPTPGDIGRELGGVIDSAGNVLNEAGQVVINVKDEVLRKGEELFSSVHTNLNHFIGEELPEFERYIRRDFGSDLEEAINNLIIKPINWIFCGGKQPADIDDPHRDDDCIEGGLRCTRSGADTECTLTDSQGNASDVPNSDDNIITQEQLQWMRDMELQDYIRSSDFSESLSSWFLDSIDASTIQNMLASHQANLNSQLSNVDNMDDSDLAIQIVVQKSVIDLIEVGANAAAVNVISTFKDLMNIVKTLEELKSTINFVSENGFVGLVDAIGNNFTNYWNEFSNSDSIGKAEIIGTVTSDVIMALVPVGALAKLGKESIRVTAATSYARRLSLNFTENVHRYLGNISGKELAALMGEFRVAGKTQGTFGFTSGTLERSRFVGKNWVGPDAIKSEYKPGKFRYESRDGTKQYREAEFKRNEGKVQANFEWRYTNSGPWIGNAHMDIID